MVDYVRGTGSLPFSAEQLELLRIEFDKLRGADMNVSGLCDEIYRLILSFCRVVSNGIESRNPDVDPEVYAWIRGAGDVNRNSGFYAAYIREYTRIQYESRGGTDNAYLRNNRASNSIGLALANDILTYGTLPGIVGLGAIDAGAAASEVFSGIPGSDYGAGDYTGWAGTLLFPFLTSKESFYSNFLLSTSPVSGSLPGGASVNFKHEKGMYDLIASLKAHKGAAMISGVSDPATAIATLFGAGDAPMSSRPDLVSATSAAFNAYYQVGTINVGEYAAISGSFFHARNVEFMVGTGKADSLSARGPNLILHAGEGDDRISGSESIAEFDQGSVIDGGGGKDSVTFYTVADTFTLDGASFKENGDFKYRLALDERVNFYGIEKFDISAAGAVKLKIKGGSTFKDLEKIAISAHEDNEIDGDGEYKLTVKNLGEENSTLKIDGMAKEFVLTGFNKFKGSSAGDDVEGGLNDNKIDGKGGNDTLKGGGGNDTLLGGEGDDVLEGGEDADLLQGESGFDTYRLNGNFGAETIIDSDGQGAVLVNGIQLTGGKRKGDYFEDEATGVRYIELGDRLFVIIPGATGFVSIKQWSNGQLGINLQQDSRKPAPVSSPIIIDLDGDGIRTLGTSSKVYFDHAGDGFAELTGWVGANDALLVRDINGDGRITSGRELFGSETRLQSGLKAANGYEALRELDLNGDGRLDAKDPLFGTLKLWVDKNGNGATDEGELTGLSRSGVIALNTASESSTFVDGNGNLHGQLGSFVREDGSVGKTADVWFVADHADTRATGPAPQLSEQVKALPDVSGVGKVRSLREVMVHDDVLRDLVARVETTTNAEELTTLIRDIVWRWAGVDGTPVGGRGTYIPDARWLRMIEAVSGEGYLQWQGQDGWSPDPGPNASMEIYSKSQDFYEFVRAKLMQQTQMKSLYDLIDVKPNDDFSALTLDLGRAIATIDAAIGENHFNGLRLLAEFSRTLHALGHWTVQVSTQMRDAFSGAGEEAALEIIDATYPPSTGLFNIWSNDDTLIQGTAGNDALLGGAGDDTLLGAEGNDTLVGGDGDDVFEGSSGDDLLYGGNGGDTYRYGFGDGNDTIVNRDVRFFGDKVDRVVFDADVTPGDVRLSRISTDLIMSLGEGNRLTLQDFFVRDANWPNEIDRFVFADGTIWTTDDVRAQLLRPTLGDDVLDGTARSEAIVGLAGRDQLWGREGNDSLSGDDGDDILDGGSGDDLLSGGQGNDVLSGGDGNDVYLYNQGDGSDIIEDVLLGDHAGGHDTLRFGSGILPESVSVSRVGNDLFLSVGERSGTASQTVRIRRYFEVDANSVEAIVFADGTTWDAERVVQALVGGTAGADSILGSNGGDLINGLGGADNIAGLLGDDTLSGGDGDDRLSGNQGNDVLDGGAGSDLLSGGQGNNTIRFGRNSARDYLELSAGGGVGVDTLALDAGVMPGEVALRRDGQHLVLSLAGSGAQLIVLDYFAAGQAQTPRNLLNVAFSDGTSWSDATLRQLAAVTAPTITVGGDGRRLMSGEGDLTLGTDSDDLRATGAANSRLMGNAADNVLTGNAGNDVLNGPNFLDTRVWSAVQNPTGARDFSESVRGGRDTLVGGAGDDVYYTTSINGEGNPYINYPNQLGIGNDTVIELAGEGHDTVVTTAYHETLADNVEDLITFNAQDYYYTNNGQHIDHTYTGNALNNVIDASRILGSVRIDGGAGADTMIGGNDANVTFVVDDINDVIQGKDGVGSLTRDTIEASISYTLTAGVENLVLTGSAATIGTGNALNNLLDGSQNAAANTLVGGLGDDTYRVDASDVIVENAGEGYDTVVIASAGAAAIFTLNPIASVERVVLDEAVGAIGVSGSNSSDSFVGNSKSNLLQGGAGDDELDDGWIWDPMWGRFMVSGQDTLDGGAGNDLIRTHGDYDYVIGGAGNDTISLAFDSRGSARVFFNRGDGQDWLTETAVGQVDVEFGAGIDAADLQFSRQGDDLQLKLAGSSDSMTFAQAFVDSGAEPFRGTLGSVTFADGFSLTYRDVRSLFLNGSSTMATEENDVLIAGAASDTLAGGGGDDRISAGAGDDELSGGQGNDSLYGGQGNDVYRFNLGDGFDEISDASGVDTLVLGVGLNEADLAVTAWWPNDLLLTFGSDSIRLKDGRVEGSTKTIEFIRFADGTVRDIAYVRSLEAIRGGDGDDNMVGDVYDERILGLAGNDTLDGGGGKDTLIGGLGDDAYVIDSGDDVVVEGVSQGTDVIRTSVSYALPDNVENIVLTGTAAISATGNGLNNKLDGNAGANVLDGGAGADTMKGLGGDDTYVVDNAGDVVTESSNQGNDKVIASVSYTLASNVEQLVLSGTSDINGTGNTLANVLTGNAGANVLSGGTGNDTMSGGQGNDTYVVDAVGDVVIENAGEGVDLVQSAVTWTLGANVENLTLTGTGAINGTGNTLDNVLTGNSGANKLDGGAGADMLIGAAGADSLTGGAGNDTLDGGAGNDTMLGGAGDDTYYVDATTDVITESAGEGSDTVFTTITLTLGANVENVTLQGTGALSATGNSGDNLMIGNSGVNTLTGGAGNDTLQGAGGNDSLVGGAGADLYVFSKGDGTDTIQDSDSTANVLDQLSFGTGITRAATTFKKVNNNLEISFTGTTTDKVVVKDWYLGAANQVERVVFADGTVLTNAQVNTAAGQPATAKVTMARMEKELGLFEDLGDDASLGDAFSEAFDVNVTRQADALVAAMASFSNSSSMATNAALPSYWRDEGTLIAVAAR